MLQWDRLEESWGRSKGVQLGQGRMLLGDSQGLVRSGGRGLKGYLSGLGPF